MYKGRIENTSTHQERITPALRTLQKHINTSTTLLRTTREHIENLF